MFNGISRHLSRGSSRRLVLTWSWGILALGFTSVAFAQKADVSKKEADAAVKSFVKYYGNKNEYVRKAAVDDLGNINHAATVIPLLRAIRDKAPIVRDAVAPALAKQTTKPALAELTRQLGKGKLTAKIAIMEAFRTTRPAVAFPTIEKLALGRVFETKLLAAELLPLITGKEKKARDHLWTLSSDKDPQVRLTAMEGLVALGHEKGADRFLELMDTDVDWRVRSVCIKALRELRLKRSIQPFIDGMTEQEGRLRDDCYEALVDVTDQEFSADAKVWQRWWDRSKARFKVPTKAQIAERRRKEAEAAAEYDRPAEDETPYHGITTRSKRMLFVLDISSSMVDKVVTTGISEKRLAAFRERYRGFETKIELAREELIDVIARMKPYVKFNIVVFNSEVKKWKPKLVSCGGNRSGAIKFLSRLTPDYIQKVTLKTGKNRTNTFDALNEALGLTKKPSAKPRKNHVVENDTVFFLTDGLPTTGRIADPQRLLRYFETVNRRARIVFHTITFGQDNRDFLNAIAITSGGKHVTIAP